MPGRRDTLLDTGPLVAVLDARDQWHAAVVGAWPELVTRCLTSEAVVTEACHLVLRGTGSAVTPLKFLVEAEIPILGLETRGHRRALSLMERYASLPMDYADATLVAISEALHITQVFTLDRRGFGRYAPPRGKKFSLIPSV